MAFSWSFTKLNLYELCPFKYKMTAVRPIQVKDEFGQEAKEGIEIHEALDKRLHGGQPLTGMRSEYERFCRAIEAAPGDLYPEVQFCMTRDFKQTKWDDWDRGWFRGVLDVLKVNNTKAIILDWKTGKVKEEPEQLEFFANLVFLFFPEVQNVSARYIWLKYAGVDESKVMGEPYEYQRHQTKELWAKHLPRVVAFEKGVNNQDYPTRKNGLCKDYCVVKKVGKCPEFK